MDQRIADALSRGRAQLRAGKRAAAIATWKDAMRAAYETQDHAAAFVLSKNLGDASLTMSDATAAQEALGYFDYALQLLDGCGLQDDHAFYPPLESVVQYLRRRRRRAKRLLEAPTRATEPQHSSSSVDAISVASASRHSNATVSPIRQDAVVGSQFCSTCEQQGSVENPIVVDEADGCRYCKSCFDAYYAEEEEEEAAASPTEDPSNHMLAELEVEGVQSQSMEEDEEDEEESASEVELEQVDDEIPDNAAEPSDEQTALADKDSSSGTHFAPSIHPEPPTLFPESCSVGTEEGEAPRPPLHDDQEVADTPTRDIKLVYNIQQLKSLRVVNQPCPAEVASSAVSVTKMSEQTPDSRPSSATRNQKPPSKKIKRSNTEAKTTDEAPNQSLVQTPLLPTLAECEAVRSNLTSTPSPLQLASALFDAVPGNPAGVASSFAAQRQLFSEAS